MDKLNHITAKVSPRHQDYADIGVCQGKRIKNSQCNNRQYITDQCKQKDIFEFAHRNKTHDVIKYRHFPREFILSKMLHWI